MTDFVKKTKLTELEKISDVSSLATKTALTAVENNITANKSKHLLIENAFKKLKTFDLVYFIGKVTLKNQVLKIIQYFNQ